MGFFRSSWRRPKPTLADQAADALTEFDAFFAPRAELFTDLREAFSMVIDFGRPDDVTTVIGQIDETIRIARFWIKTGKSFEDFAELKNSVLKG